MGQGHLLRRLLALFGHKGREAGPLAAPGLPPDAPEPGDLARLAEDQPLTVEPAPTEPELPAPDEPPAEPGELILTEPFPGELAEAAAARAPEALAEPPASEPPPDLPEPPSALAQAEPMPAFADDFEPVITVARVPGLAPVEPPPPAAPQETPPAGAPVADRLAAALDRWSAAIARSQQLADDQARRQQALDQTLTQLPELIRGQTAQAQRVGEVLSRLEMNVSRSGESLSGLGETIEQYARQFDSYGSTTTQVTEVLEQLSAGIEELTRTTATQTELIEQLGEKFAASGHELREFLYRQERRLKWMLIGGMLLSAGAVAAVILLVVLGK